MNQVLKFQKILKLLHLMMISVKIVEMIDVLSKGFKVVQYLAMSETTVLCQCDTAAIWEPEKEWLRLFCEREV
jgi:hypothetical protein